MASKIMIPLALATPAMAFALATPAMALQGSRGHAPSLAFTTPPTPFQPAAWRHTAAVPPQHRRRAGTVYAQELGEREIDVGCLGRIVIGWLIQMIGITTVFSVLDLACYGPLPGNVQLGGPLPWQAVVGIFLGLSVSGSRLFIPFDTVPPELRNAISAEEDASLVEYLDAGKFKAKVLFQAAESRGLLVDNTMDRPALVDRLRLYLADAEATAGADDAAARDADAGDAARSFLPEWLPPTAIEWALLGPLHAAAASLVFEASTGRLNEAYLNDPVLLWLVFHLVVRDTWSNLARVERRIGAAVPGAAVVWLSAAFTAKQFYDVTPLAGGLLVLPLVWFSAEAASAASKWRALNSLNALDEAQGEPLYPYKRAGFRSATRLTFEPWGGGVP